MTTIVAQLTPAMALRVAAAADRLDLSHSEVAVLALTLFLRAEAAGAVNERTNERTNEQIGCRSSSQASALTERSSA